jgi:hypothetical protein
LAPHPAQAWKKPLVQGAGTPESLAESLPFAIRNRRANVNFVHFALIEAMTPQLGRSGIISLTTGGEKLRIIISSRFTSPYSEKLFSRVAAGTRADARVAVDGPPKALTGWSETTPPERARLLLEAAEILKRRRTEIAEVLAREIGSTISFATCQQDPVASPRAGPSTLPRWRAAAPHHQFAPARRG